MKDKEELQKTDTQQHWDGRVTPLFSLAFKKASNRVLGSLVLIELRLKAGRDRFSPLTSAWLRVR